MEEMTLKMKRAARLVESSRTMGEALLGAGYSPNTAIKPSQVTKSKGWQELLNEKLPDDILFSKHKELLEASKIIVSPTEPDREYPDYPTQVRALDLGYKVKGKYSDTIVNQTNITQMDVRFIARDKDDL